MTTPTPAAMRAADVLFRTPAPTLEDVARLIDAELAAERTALANVAEYLGLPETATPEQIAEAAGNAWAQGVHSCHDQCQKPLCVAGRQIRRVREWVTLSDSALRLRCGELTAQEIRSIRAVLNAISAGCVGENMERAQAAAARTKLREALEYVCLNANERNIRSIAATALEETK